MAEIKSTLDLVLEKTRHLTLSDDERREQRREEAKRLLQGRMLKYEQGALHLSELVEWLRQQALGEEAGARRVQEEILARVQPQGQAGPWLRLWEAFSGIDPQPLNRILEDCRREESEAGAAHRQGRLRELRRRGIEGTAIDPNFGRDPDWQQARAALRRRCGERLEAQKQRLLKHADERRSPT